MPTFRKKPVEIEAFPVIDMISAATSDRGGLPDWLRTALAAGDVRIAADGVMLRTLEGWLHASRGDWIIRGIQSEIYSCKPDIFAATYEAVANQPATVGSESA